MSKRPFRFPSPALVISTLALALALGGTAIAAGNRSAPPLTKQAVTKLIQQLAPSLHVKSAVWAKSSGVARSLTNITYVKGPVFDVPANGGSGTGEGGGDSSLTQCPAGTYVIGAGVETQDQGEAINELIPETPGGGSQAPTEVRAFVDNFTNTDQPNNWVIAVCARARSVSDLSNIAKRRSVRR